jgi:hypothetical protein
MAKRGSGQERTWALLSHLSFFVLFLVLAIVLRVTVGRRDPFTRHHTTEALNAQTWFLVVWNALWIPLFLTSGDGAEPPAWAWLGPLFGFVAFLARQDSRSVAQSKPGGESGGGIRCRSGSCQGRCPAATGPPRNRRDTHRARPRLGTTERTTCGSH